MFGYIVRSSSKTTFTTTTSRLYHQTSSSWLNSIKQLCSCDDTSSINGINSNAGGEYTTKRYKSGASQQKESLYRKLSTISGQNLKKTLKEIKEGKLGTKQTVSHFKQDIGDKSNPANSAIRQLNEKETSFDGIYFIDSVGQLKRTFEIIKQEHVISFDLEGIEMGKQGEVALIQIGLMNGRIFIFDVLSLGQTLFGEGLKDILESKTVLKIVHDCRRDSEILYHRHQVNLTHIYDIQIAHALIQKKKEGNVPIRRYGLQELIHLYTPRVFSERAVDIKYKGKEYFTTQNDNSVWKTRPLPPLLIDYCALDVATLHPIYNAINPQLSSPFDKKFLKKHFEEQLTYFKDSIRQLFSRNLI